MYHLSLDATVQKSLPKLLLLTCYDTVANQSKWAKEHKNTDNNSAWVLVIQ